MLKTTQILSSLGSATVRSSMGFQYKPAWQFQGQQTVSEDRVGASQTVDYDSLMGNQAILDMLAEGAATSGSMDTASLRLVEGGAVKTLPPDAVPTTQGEDPAESMVEGMAKLNKSKSLAHHDPVKDKVDDPWDE